MSGVKQKSETQRPKIAEDRKKAETRNPKKPPRMNTKYDELRRAEFSYKLWQKEDRVISALVSSFVHSRLPFSDFGLRVSFDLLRLGFGFLSLPLSAGSVLKLRA